MNDSSSDVVLAALRAWVAEAPVGARLPTTRALVATHRVSPVTVQKALRSLQAAGLVESRAGVGTFKAAPAPSAAPDYGWQTASLGAPRARYAAEPPALRTTRGDLVALHAGYPHPDLLPLRLLRAAFARAARGDSVEQRPPAAGLPELRAWFAHELAGPAAPGVSAPTASDVVVMPGSQSGLSATFRALAGAGRPVVVESPTYWGAIRAAEQAGVVLVPVPGGPHGPDPEDVDRALERSGAGVFYAQPSFANPTGARWSQDVAGQVLAVVRARGAFLVEDDWAHDLAIDGDPHLLAARDTSGHVIHLRSLTKSVSPAVRVAAVVARGPVRDRLLAAAQAESLYVSGLLQAVALDVVSQPAWRTHLRHLRPRLRSRRDHLRAMLRTHAPTAGIDDVPAGGLNQWVRLPEGTHLPSLVAECEAGGLGLAAGDEWFPAEPPAPYARLSFAAADPADVERGVRVLGEVLARRAAG